MSMKLFRCGKCGTVVAFELLPDRRCVCVGMSSEHAVWEELSFINVRTPLPPLEDPNAP